MFDKTAESKTSEILFYPDEKRNIWIILFLLLISSVVYGQNQNATVSGTVKDQRSGEALVGVNIFLKDTPSVGTVTNDYGFYSMTIPEGQYEIIYNYLGYRSKAYPVKLEQDTKIEVELELETEILEEVVLSEKNNSRNVISPLAGVSKLKISEIEKIPVIFGESDLLKTLQLLPGIKAAGEASTGLYIRGGGADQNLILLDNALVYNASHLLGFFSTFNSAAIKDVTVYKGGMPAEYGGRLSSVIDINMKEGNNQDYQVSGGLGLISSRLNVEGPISKGKSSFLLSGRRTYGDLFLKLSNDDLSETALYFYDLNAKINYSFSDRNKIFLSGYFGQDVFKFKEQFDINWGNSTATIRWNHLATNKLFSNTSLIYSDYSYGVGLEVNSNRIGINSIIQDVGLKQEFDFYPNPKNSMEFGLHSTFHSVLPGEISFSGAAVFDLPPLEKKYSWENALFFSNEWNPNPTFQLLYGLRLSFFSLLGPGEFIQSNDQEDFQTIEYSSGEFIKTYKHLEPRISGVVKLTDESSLKAAYVRTTQNMHLLTNSSTSNPTDRWVSSSNIIKPQVGDQISAGYFRNFAANQYEFSGEFYYKNLQNQIDYRDGADITNSTFVETELLFGKGRAYGLELLLKKKYGQLSGWIGYTLSRTERAIEGINQGEWYPAKHDRTHDLSIVGMYDLSEKWAISASWVFNTGNAVTFPSGKYIVDDQVVFYYTERNGYRMPDYHRLDLGATMKLKQSEKFSSELVFSLYNAYGRENPFLINFRESKINPGTTEAYQLTLFKFVPSVSYNFKF